MILLPGCLPNDRSMLDALCRELQPLSSLASHLRNATVAPAHGSWSDAEREAACCSNDLPAGRELARLSQFASLPTSTAPATVAVASPMHAALGLTDLTATDPELLALSADDSRALCTQADAHLRDEGVQLHFVDPLRWLVTCDRQIEVLCERPEWMTGEALRPSLPRGADARTVELWMNELQMLLYTERVNIDREDRALPPVNVVWLWGFSPLNSGENSAPALPKPDTRWLRAIRNGDVAGWQQAWVDAAPQLLSADAIILGDHRPRLRLTPQTPDVLSRIKSTFGRAPTLAQVLLSLQAAA